MLGDFEKSFKCWDQCDCQVWLFNNVLNLINLKSFQKSIKTLYMLIKHFVIGKICFLENFFYILISCMINYCANKNHYCEFEVFVFSIIKISLINGNQNDERVSKCWIFGKSHRLVKSVLLHKNLFKLRSTKRNDIINLVKFDQLNLQPLKDTYKMLT